MGRISVGLMILGAALGSFAAQQGESPLPVLPPDIPKDAAMRLVVVDKTPTGQDAVWKTPDGAIHEFFQFNDRGRGPKIYTTYHVGPDGLVTSEESRNLHFRTRINYRSFDFAHPPNRGMSCAQDDNRNRKALARNNSFLARFDFLSSRATSLCHPPIRRRWS